MRVVESIIVCTQQSVNAVNYLFETRLVGFVVAFPSILQKLVHSQRYNSPCLRDFIRGIPLFRHFDGFRRNIHVHNHRTIQREEIAFSHLTNNFTMDVFGCVLVNRFRRHFGLFSALLRENQSMLVILIVQEQFQVFRNSGIQSI